MRPASVLVLAASVLAVGFVGGCDGSGQVDFQKIIATAKRRVYPALVHVKPIKEEFGSGERQRQELPRGL